MNDEELDRLLDDASRAWRVSAHPPLDRIWEAVSAEAFNPPSRSSRWGIVAVAATAALVVGVAAGRYSVRTAALSSSTIASTPAPVVMADRVSNLPDQRAMGELLGRTALLLAVLPPDSVGSTLDPQITREAARLLATTRLLLDSHLDANGKLHNLLQDLELVLAQVARIEPRHRADDMQFIQTALDEHDIVPRLRSAAADLSLDDF